MIRIIFAILLAVCMSNASIAAETTPAPTPAPAAGASDAMTVKRLEAKDWCSEHDLPKDSCMKCDQKLIPAFKKKGDFCKEHGVPESLCVQCDPEVKKKLDAMRPLKDEKAK
ncbi:MAG: hypothetical protein H0W83_02255 [Planctomycetes bacterium]|nr:hypothetical protein [Planctomycetota bacterium]